MSTRQNWSRFGSTGYNVIRDLWRTLEDTPRDIQHIGSTAISKIHAKPIVDIVIGMNNKEHIKKA